MGDSKINRHVIRRILIASMPIIGGIVCSILLCHFNKEKYCILISTDFENAVSLVIGIWGTLLGFIITAVSILVAFTGSKLTEEIKQTGHFKTVLFSYVFTCFVLLLCISFFMIVILNKIYNFFIYGIFVACLIISFLEVALCIIFLTMVIYTIFK